MPRLIFVNRFFHPDHSATSQILGECIAVQRRGRIQANAAILRNVPAATSAMLDWLLTVTAGSSNL